MQIYSLIPLFQKILIRYYNHIELKLIFQEIKQFDLFKE